MLHYEPEMFSGTEQEFRPMEPVLLGPIEDYFWRFERELGRAYRVTILVRLDGCVEPGFLAAALTQLRRRHPKLRAKIAKADSGLFYFHFSSETPAIPFRILDYDEGESPWREEARQLLQRDLPAAGPLAEVVVLRNRKECRSDLLLTTTHAIADGLSAIMLVDDLLTEYASAEAGERSQLPALPLVMAGRAKSAIGWRGRFRLFRRFVRLKREKRGVPLTRLPETFGIEPHSQCVHWVFGLEDTLRLVRRCRKEHASMSGFLMAAAFLGILDCLSEPEALFRWELPFSIRDDLEGPAGPVTAQDLGCFISNMNGSCQISGLPPFWDVARRIDRDMQEFVSLGGPSFGYNAALSIHNMISKAKRMLKRLGPKPMLPKGERSTLLATYYGVLNMRDAYGTLRPRACTFILNNHVAGSSLTMEALVLRQQLNLGFIATGLEPEFWEKLQGAVLRRLDCTPYA